MHVELENSWLLQLYLESDKSSVNHARHARTKSGCSQLRFDMDGHSLRFSCFGAFSHTQTGIPSTADGYGPKVWPKAWSFSNTTTSKMANAA